MVSEVDQNGAFLPGLPQDYEVTVESIMNYKQTYSETASKLIVRESRLGKSEFASPQALMTMTPPPSHPCKCLYCGKQWHVAQESL